MRKLLSVLLIVGILTSFFGCGTENTQGDTSLPIGGTETSTKREETNPVETAPPYRDDQALFGAQNRYDVKDDKYTIYLYNYKGDLLNTTDPSAYIGCYAGNGLAPATDRSSGKMGYVDRDGVFQITPIYKEAGPFSSFGLALVVNHDEKLGFVDSEGCEVIPCKYKYATGFLDCGYAVVAEEKEVNNGEASYSYDPASVNANERCYVIDIKGNVVTEIKEGYSLLALYKDYYVIRFLDQIVIMNYGGEQLSEFNILWDTYPEIIYDVFARNNAFYRTTCKNKKEATDVIKEIYHRDYVYETVKVERFDGTKFVEDKSVLCTFNAGFTQKRVATTWTGFGWGVEKNGKTVIPFQYDSIISQGDYFVACKYGDELKNSIIDIYDKDLNQTASNLHYSYAGYVCNSYRAVDTWTKSLPNGYFYISQQYTDERGNNDQLGGIINYEGKIILEPVFYGMIATIMYQYQYDGTRDFGLLNPYYE